MFLRKNTRGRVITAAALAGTLLLSACGGSGGGGRDTTCKDFLSMNDSGKEGVIKQIAKEEGEDNPAAEEVELASGLFAMMCQMVKDDSVKLMDIDEDDIEDFDESVFDDLD